MSKIAFTLLAGVGVVEGGGYGNNPRPEYAGKRGDQNVEKPPHWKANTMQPLPNLDIDEMPKDFSWGNINGRSFLTPSWNQHIPFHYDPGATQYCGSCWIHGTMSMVQDRMKIALHNFPEHSDIHLARQTMLNCGKDRGFGAGCGGGEAEDVLQYMHEYGLGDDTCNPYVAHTNNECTPDGMGECMNCMMFTGDKQGHCWAVPTFTRYRVKEYGTVSGEQQIMTEIFKRGPVVCGMACFDEFNFGYTGGVFRDTTNASDVDHDVEVVGWGEDEGEKYWLVRNSWGSYWGENGYFRVVRGENQLHIEDGCNMAEVDVSELIERLEGKYKGSMYGVIPNDQEPQYLPDNFDIGGHKWDKSKPHPKANAVHEFYKNGGDPHRPTTTAEALATVQQEGESAVASAAVARGGLVEEEGIGFSVMLSAAGLIFVGGAGYLFGKHSASSEYQQIP